MTRALAAMAVIAGMSVAACDARPDRVVLGIGLSENTRSAVQLAASQINASGGVGGVPLELVGLAWAGPADRFDPASVIRSADHFAATDGLLGVIGHDGSASTLSAAATYNKQGIPQIVTIATHPAITNIGPWTYRLCLSDAAQGPALATYAVNDWKKRRIAVFFVNDDYGRGLAHHFEVRVRELGGTIVAAVVHRNALEPDDHEIIRSALATMKKDGPPDLVVLFQRVPAAQWTLRAIRDAGIEVDTLGGDSLAQASFIDGEPELTAGLRVSQFCWIDPANTRAATFARDFQALTGREPDYAQAFAYDAVYLMSDAALQGHYTRAGVRSYLDRLARERTQIHGVGGPFTLGTDHDARRSLFIAEVRDRRFHVIRPLPVD